jgi:hypothetical protein
VRLNNSVCGKSLLDFETLLEPLERLHDLYTGEGLRYGEKPNPAEIRNALDTARAVVPNPISASATAKGQIDSQLGLVLSRAIGEGEFHHSS